MGDNMRKEIVKKILTITEEELKILQQTNRHKKVVSASIQGNSLYFDKDVSVRKSTRYVGFESHSHNFIEISIGLIGSISHSIDNTPVSIGKYDVLVMGKNVDHVIKKSNERDVALNILVNETLVNKLLDRIEKGTELYTFVYNLFYKDIGEFYVQRESKDIVQSDVENFLENIYFATFFREVIKYNIEYLIMKLLYITYKSSKQVTLEETITKEGVYAYISENYSTASLEELSQLFNIDYFQLSKEIKKLTGENFKDIVQKERLEIASKLLCYSDLSVREISSQVGYENYSYFYRIFSKKYNMTPTSYRKKFM